MYDRLKLLIGEEGLNKLKDSHVLILGLGGVGGYVLEALTRSGIGKLTIIDHDKIELSNLNRQIITIRENIGKYKVNEAKKRVLSINNEIMVNEIAEFIDESNIDKLFNEKIDYFIDACDSFKTKCLVIDKCQKNNIPFITCTGTGNRMNPSKLIITDLKSTSYDPLAKKLRKYMKDTNNNGKVTCLSSTEMPLRKGKVIGSNSFVPASAGLLIASYVINSLLEVENENIKM